MAANAERMLACRGRGNLRQVGLYLLFVLAAACSANSSATATLTPAVPTPNSTSSSLITVTRPPAATQMTPPTATVRATQTPLPTATVLPTRQPNEAFWADLQKYPLTSAMTVGPGNYLYTVYVLGDITPDSPCIVYITRWDGRDQRLIYANDQTEFCFVNSWEAQGFSASERRALGLKGYWSDINQNGQPEFALYQTNGCRNDCTVANGGREEFFEIQTPDRVVDITGNLTRTIDARPGGMLHSASPLTLYAHQYDYYEAHGFTDVGWIYAWDGSQYVDVSAQYLDDYRQQAQALALKVKQAYGHPLVDDFAPSASSEMLNILTIYNDLHLPAQEGLALFLDVSKPSHWPGSKREMTCWLQLMRAYVQIDYAQNVPFRILPPIFLTLADMGASRSWTEKTQEFRDGIDEQRFDLSACKS